MKNITPRVKKDLARLLRKTHTKRGPLKSDMAALGVITEEYHEVMTAIRKGDRARIRAEMLDLANGAIRWVLANDAEAKR